MKRLKSDTILTIITHIVAVIAIGILVTLLGYIAFNGIANFKWSMLSWEYTSENLSIMPSFVTTAMITVIALVIAVPLGILSAIYLVEYAKPNSRIVQWIRIATETLSGIPSIIYGLFGMLFFVTVLKWNFSILSGALTLSIMILPFIIRTTEETLKTVPMSYREGSYSLGAGKLRTIFKVVLPASRSGILVGIILSIGRIVGETAALVYTAGTVSKMPSGVFDSARTMSVHMYVLSSEGLHTKEAYTTGFILLLIVVCMNVLAEVIVSKMSKGQGT